MQEDYYRDEDGNIYYPGDEPPTFDYPENGYPVPNQPEDDDDPYQEHDDDE